MKSATPIRTALQLLLILSVAWALTPAGAAEAQLELFALAHRPADELVPVVQPLLHEGEVVQAQGFQLIVRAAPDTLEQIRGLLARLDRAPKQLLISVRQSTSQRAMERGAGAAVRATPGDSGAKVRIYGTDDRAADGGEQQIRVLEGHAAYIDFGQSVPVGERTLVIGPGGGAVHESTRYRDVSRGFYVLPQINGERVVLHISAHRDTLSRAGGGIVNTQRAGSVVEGRLGEWFQLGGTIEHSDRSERGILYRSHERSEQQGRVAVKVEVVP